MYIFKTKKETVVNIKMHFKYFLFFFCGLIIPAYCRIAVYNKFEGDTCKTGKEQGICTLANECQVAVNMLKTFRKHSLSRCGFKDLMEIVCCPNPTKRPSEEACEQYSKDAPVLIEQFIADGENAQEGEFPHMAAIGYKENNQIIYNCGGTLINNRYVLTAGHCIITQSGIPPSTVKLGSVYIRQNGTAKLGEDYSIESAIIHPNYNIPVKYNDLALLRLDRNVIFSKTIQPACLHTSGEIKSNPVATGWGSRHHRESGSHHTLQKVSLKITDENSCDEAYEPFTDERTLPEGIQHSTMICAGPVKKKGDTCNGDSGGPLQIEMSNNLLWSIIGVTSIGTACGGNNVPGVYTKVSSYIDWIEGIVWPRR